ncbi:MAG: hypothetical protein PHC51_09560 [bacterium]|nr:hypothetical protein [bacterium]
MKIYSIITLLTVFSFLPLSACVAEENPAGFDNEKFAQSCSLGEDYYFWAAGEFEYEKMGLLQSRKELQQLAIKCGQIPLESDTHTIEETLQIQPRTPYLHIFIGSDLIDQVSISQPDGSPITASDTVQLGSFQLMTVVKILNPSPGTWRISLSARGKYMVSARVELPSGIPGLKDVRLGRMIEYLRGTQFETARSAPAAGEEVIVRAELSGENEDTSIDLITDEGKIIASPVRLRGVYNVVPPAMAFGPLKMPSEKFRIKVKIKLTNGEQLTLISKAHIN